MRCCAEPRLAVPPDVWRPGLRGAAVTGQVIPIPGKFDTLCFWYT